MNPGTLDLVLAAWCYGVACAALGASVLRL